ncbi:MAG TPA: prepilin-type N-terminal cleavage/methylation domain-containing protein [candidate division Zixibacteria bacterium]|nr:prepilin-type N-terminal cleavage/methylation domain-containing protein [candidate division Zixibacteria bacterium]
MKRFRILNDKGISLLEVLMALIVFSLGMLGLAPLMITAVDGNVISRDNNIASNLIKQQIELYEGMDSISGIPLDLYEEDVRDGFSRHTIVADNSVDSLIPAGLYRIAVEVSWTDYHDLARTREYSTFLLD